MQEVVARETVIVHRTGNDDNNGDENGVPSLPPHSSSELLLQDYNDEVDGKQNKLRSLLRRGGKYGFATLDRCEVVGGTSRGRGVGPHPKMTKILSFFTPIVTIATTLMHILWL